MRQENPRMDVVTRKRYEKERLLRFVAIEGKIAFDPSFSLKGRGFYLLKSRESIETFRKKRLYRRYGEIEDEEAFFASLLEFVENEGE